VWREWRYEGFEDLMLFLLGVSGIDDCVASYWDPLYFPTWSVIPAE
jgi:hypothetical protein